MKKGLLINTVAASFVAAGIALWSFFGASASPNTLTNEWVYVGDAEFGVDLTVDELSSARRSDRDVFYLMPESHSTVSWDEASRKVNVDLVSGGILFATRAGDFDITVDTGFVRINSSNNTAYVQMDPSGEHLDVYSLSHPASISFVLEGEVINELPIPSGHRVRIKRSKITETIGKLRLAKLSKEFPAFPLTQEDLSEQVWSTLADIDESYDTYSYQLLTSLQNNSNFGPPKTGFGASWSNFVQGVKGAVTVLPHAEKRLAESRRNQLLNYATSNLLYGDPNEAQRWLSEWSNSSSEEEQFAELNAALFFVLPGDELYEVKRIASKQSEQETPKERLRREYQDIADLLARGDLKAASEAYRSYKEDFENELKSGTFNSPEGIEVIAREYIVLEDLIKNESVFYSLDSVDLLTQLESKILEQTLNQRELDEERQVFIQSKIAFLNTLFDFVVDRKVTQEVAADLAEHLLDTAKKYMSKVTTKNAVIEYFDSELERFELSVQFMRSPEFFSYTSFEDGLKAYKQKLADLDDLNDYLQGLKDGESSDGVTIELKDAILEVGRALGDYGIQFGDINHLGDAPNRLFEILNGRAKGHSFTAKYDRQTQIFYDIESEGIQFSTGILINKFGEVLDRALTEDLSTPEVEEPTEPIETPDGPNITDSVALQLVSSHFTDAGLEPRNFTFTILSTKDNTFTFKGTLGAYKVPIEASYDANSRRAYDISWTYKDEERAFPAVNLVQLPEALADTIAGINQNSETANP